MTWLWVVSFCGVYTLGVAVGMAAAKIVEGRRARQRLVRFIALCPGSREVPLEQAEKLWEDKGNQKYRPRHYVPVDAILWNGHNDDEVKHWCAEREIFFQQRGGDSGFAMPFRHPGRFFSCPRWIVVHESGRLDAMTMSEFDERYEPIEKEDK